MRNIGCAASASCTPPLPSQSVIMASGIGVVDVVVDARAHRAMALDEFFIAQVPAWNIHSRINLGGLIGAPWLLLLFISTF
jgi:hypothetical protein